MYTCHICEYQTKDKIKFKVHALTPVHAMKTTSFFILNKQIKGYTPDETRKYETVHKLAILFEKDIIDYVSDLLLESKTKNTYYNKLFNFVTYDDSTEPRQMIAEQNRRRIILNELITTPRNGNCNCSKCNVKRKQIETLRKNNLSTPKLSKASTQKKYEDFLMGIIDTIYNELIPHKDKNHMFLKKYCDLYLHLIENNDYVKGIYNIIELCNNEIYENQSTPFNDEYNDENDKLQKHIDKLNECFRIYASYLIAQEKNKSETQRNSDRLEEKNKRIAKKITEYIKNPIDIDIKWFNLGDFSPVNLKNKTYIKQNSSKCFYDKNETCDEGCECIKCVLKNIKNERKMRLDISRNSKNNNNNEPKQGDNVNVFKDEQYHKHANSDHNIQTNVVTHTETKNGIKTITTTTTNNNNSTSFNKIFNNNETFPNPFNQLESIIKQNMNREGWSEAGNEILQKLSHFINGNLMDNPNENIIINNYNPVSNSITNDINFNEFVCGEDDYNDDSETDSCDSDSDNDVEIKGRPNLFTMKSTDYKILRDNIYHYRLTNHSMDKKTFDCALCSKTYKFFSGVKKHLKDKHNINAVEYNYRGAFCENITNDKNIDDEMIEFYLFDLYYKYPHVYFQLSKDYYDVMNKYTEEDNYEECRLDTMRIMFRNNQKYIDIGSGSNNEDELKKLYDIEM